MPLLKNWRCPSYQQLRKRLAHTRGADEKLGEGEEEVFFVEPSAFPQCL